MDNKIKLALIQMRCGENLGENYDKAVGFIRKAASQGANIICTQELFKSRYFPQVVDSDLFGLAEEINARSPTLRSLSELARELQVVIVAGLFEKRASGLYHNTAVVLDADGKWLGKYRKMHIPDDPLYYEKFYFTPGDLGYKVFRTRYANIGVLICWDQWFPEAARLTVMSGAELIVIPTAIGHSAFEDKADAIAYRDAWQIVQRGHAVANACYLAAINRVGFEESREGGAEIDFWGRSFVSDPNGQILKQAAGDEEELLLCSIDLSYVEKVRKSFSFPFRDRRVDSYSGLTDLLLD
jgi:N-carbamoylputrescine amidase